MASYLLQRLFCGKGLFSQFPFQFLPRPHQAGADRGWFDGEDAGDFLGGHLFVVKEIDDHAVVARKVHDGVKQFTLGGVVEGGGIPVLIQGKDMPAPCTAQDLAAFVDCHTDQPVAHVRFAFKGCVAFQ